MQLYRSLLQALFAFIEDLFQAPFQRSVRLMDYRRRNRHRLGDHLLRQLDYPQLHHRFYGRRFAGLRAALPGAVPQACRHLAHRRHAGNYNPALAIDNNLYRYGPVNGDNRAVGQLRGRQAVLVLVG
jgi:hypothetical protein